jgi:hypothetical protein
MALRLPRRQCEIEGASLAGFGLHPDAASMALHDLLGDRQTDAGTGGTDCDRAGAERSRTSGSSRTGMSGKAIVVSNEVLKIAYNSKSYCSHPIEKDFLHDQLKSQENALI